MCERVVALTNDSQSVDAFIERCCKALDQVCTSGSGQDRMQDIRQFNNVFNRCAARQLNLRLFNDLFQTPVTGDWLRNRNHDGDVFHRVAED